MSRIGTVMRLCLSALALTGATLPAARAAALTVVAVGASNTSGWGVGAAAAYPARLEELLRERGLDVQVVNAGRPFDTTSGMLGRLDAVVPDGTQLVVLQPGANDLRFFGTRERRAANIEAMVARLTARGIPSIVYDPVFPREIYQWDGIHITPEGHARIAQDLAPQVIEALKPAAQAVKRPKASPR
ncbi:GDSL-type esterase/lipase family protein [Methylobacterium gnaphalii]|uniref:Arylesterase n=1 Tax=Methylobacterium gnaphalii TaxID=1010610 RepID=A0A512JNG5_9HYPH|nr:GDSL-type esterase/lipase family protein [Methylobacterium gnaphalii]GEP11500.1 arylesterase [Methylobacterium gnaphalii]GJD70166.1 Arylesterase [Methylobacterium gnaphalii]GLS49504.1 arylesterase [Methylobacterium gnaphalii]